MIAAAIYGSLREMGASRTLSEISELSNVKRKELAKAFRVLVFKLDFKVPAADPIKHIAKVANKANITERAKRHAVNIMYSLIKKGITVGKDPSSLAATALYLASRDTNENITQKDLAAASRKSEVTIRLQLREIKKSY
jgi:transcription initiation factor TFIIB